MNDIFVTLSGNVTDDPRQYQFRDGSRVTSMRMAVNRRVLDPQTNTWQTRDTTYYTVRCWRGLADNVQQSIRRGHPVVVYGKLRIKQFERDGETRFWAEIEASSVGHDLKWGIATFEKPIRAYATGAPSDDERQAMEDATREWELTGSVSPGPGIPGPGIPGAAGSGLAYTGGGDGDGDEAFDTLVGQRGTAQEGTPTPGTRHAVRARHAGETTESGTGNAEMGEDAGIRGKGENAGTAEIVEDAGTSGTAKKAGTAEKAGTAKKVGTAKEAGTAETAEDAEERRPDGGGDDVWLPRALAA